MATCPVETIGSSMVFVMNDEVFTLILVGLSVFVGAIAQGAIGFGMGLVAAPVITMLNPSVMPGAIQVVNVTLPLFTLAAEWRRVDWRGLGFAVRVRSRAVSSAGWSSSTSPPGPWASSSGRWC